MRTADPCNWCTLVHSPTLLCGPAAQILNNLVERAEQCTVPATEFERPQDGGFVGDHVLLAQLRVEAAAVPLAGLTRPALIFTGLDEKSQPQARWLLPGTDKDLRAAADLVAKMAELAIRGAAAARG